MSDVGVGDPCWGKVVGDQTYPEGSNPARPAPSRRLQSASSAPFGAFGLFGLFGLFFVSFFLHQESQNFFIIFRCVVLSVRLNKLPFVMKLIVETLQ